MRSVKAQKFAKSARASDIENPLTIGPVGCIEDGNGWTLRQRYWFVLSDCREGRSGRQNKVGEIMQQFIIAAVLLAMACPILWRCVRMILLWKGMLRSNYSGDRIIIGSGLLLPFIMLAYALVFSNGNKEEVMFFTLAVVLVAGIGWLDDTRGDSTTKGLRGHLRAWLQQGRWTTGLLKLMGIAMTSISIAVVKRPEWMLLPFVVLLPPLSANALNLLDVRPGRALKSAIAAMVLLILLSPEMSWNWTLWLPILISAMYLLPKDLKKEAMLGDTGANAFGFAIGYILAYYGGLVSQGLAFILLLYLHYLAERESITARIERSPWLSWLDRWGRV
jgi:UDP-GlcNAc:undecaprenyl-phosphate/decaprenyl-phosphate GlcNAc-1-phosphate transferase